MDEQIINKTIQDVLDLLGISGTFDIAKSSEQIDVVLDTPESGMVIGYHGEVLEALQLILALSLAKKTGTFTRVSVDVGDYKKNRTEYLENLARQTKEKVLAEQKEFSLSGLKSWERRIIHTALTEDSEVLSESVGEGRERTLIIRPR